MSVFPTLHKKQRLASLSYKELSTYLCSLVSYRNAAGLMNRLLRRNEGEDQVQLKTLFDFVEREGADLDAYQEEFTRQTLKSHGFDPESALPCVPQPRETTHPAASTIPETEVERALFRCNGSKNGQERVDAARLHDQMEDPDGTTYVSIDDIGVTRQKETRRPGSSRETKYVENTVIHIAHKAGSYRLAGVGMEKMMHFLIAFLLSNHLLCSRNLLFFTDGARNIRSSLEKLLPYRPYTIILDWYHLEKKCREYLSSALKGKEIRNEVSEELLKYLWVGNVEYATEYLRRLGADKVRNQGWITSLIQYIDKNYSYIPCYALRKELGLRNSSNPVEKSNDLVVAQRQKHNGMSWSARGSSSLTTIRAMYLNGENESWLKERMLKLQMSCVNEGKACA